MPARCLTTRKVSVNLGLYLADRQYVHCWFARGVFRHYFFNFNQLKIMVTIKQQIQKAKEDLELEIETALEKFEQTTGLEIDRIEIVKRGTYNVDALIEML